MAFKMKNPSIAKMVKAAGDNRVAMKMKAESAMKMKEAAMKLERDAAMKKYVSDAQRKAVHASKAESAMKAAKPDYIDIDGDGNKTESMKKAAADKKSPAKMGHSPKKMKKGSAVKTKTGSMHVHSSGETHDKDGKKMITGDDGLTRTQREVYYGGDKLKDEIARRVERQKAAKKDSKSPAKKKSAMKKKSFEYSSSDFRQTEEQRKADRGEGRNPKQKRSDFYREKKARRKAEKSRKADAKAREAQAKMEEAVYGKNFENVVDGKLKPKTKKEQKAASKASRKAIRTGTRARVKEAVAQRQLGKKGSDYQGPKRPKREKKNLAMFQ